MKRSDVHRVSIKLGLESTEPEVVETEVTFPAEDTESAGAIEDQQELQADIDDVNELDKFNEATTDVEELTVAVECSIASGKGLNRFEAAALNKALSASMGKYLPVENNLVPGREAYDATETDNNLATTKETKKGLGQSTKEFIKMIVAKIMSIFQKARNSFKQVTDRFRTTKDQLRKNTALVKDNLPEGETKVKFNTVNLYLAGTETFDLQAVSVATKEFSNGVTIISEFDPDVGLVEAINAINSGDEAAFKAAMEKHETNVTSTFEKLPKGELPSGKKFTLTQDGMFKTIRLKRAEKANPDSVKEFTVDKEELLNISIIALNASEKFANTAQRKSEEVAKSGSALTNAMKKTTSDETKANRDFYTGLSGYVLGSVGLFFNTYDLTRVIASNIAQLNKAAVEAGAENKPNE